MVTSESRNDSTPKKRFSIRQRIAGFRYALRGLKLLLVTQHNARIHLLATMTVGVTGWALKIKPGEWCMLLLAIGMVLSAEAMNTAVEFLADVVCPDHHPEIGRCKDVAAASVLIASTAAAAIGMIVLLPHLAEFL